MHSTLVETKKVLRKIEESEDIINTFSNLYDLIENKVEMNLYDYLHKLNGRIFFNSDSTKEVTNDFIELINLMDSLNQKIPDYDLKHYGAIAKITLRGNINDSQPVNILKYYKSQIKFMNECATAFDLTVDSLEDFLKDDSDTTTVQDPKPNYDDNSYEINFQIKIELCK